MTQTAPQALVAFNKHKYQSVRIDACIDRSGYEGSHDIKKEATEALISKITQAQVLILRPDADLKITCDIEKFSEGSAVKRWLLPGWGVTRANISVIVWEEANSKILATFKSLTEISSGGFYTVGADYYVIDVAINDIVEQLQAWVEKKDTRQ